MSLFLALFGVYSASSLAHAYPLTLSPGASSYATSSSSTTTVKMTRSSRDVAAVKPTKNTDVSTSGDGPLSPGSHNLSIGVGQVFLLGNLGNTYQNAIGTELHYTYGVSELFDFETSFGYSSHSSGAFSQWHLGADVRTNLSYYDQLVPFFTAGLGFYDPSTTIPNGSTINSLLFGMQLGTGIDLLISKSVFFGARLNYNDIFSSSKNGSDGKSYNIGGSFLTFMLHIGYTF